MKRSNQIALTSTPSEQENIRTTFFLSPSAADICIICHIDITVKYPKDKDKRERNLGCGKIVSQQLKFV